jgi:Xaa-Pro aminopeptidase
MASVKTAEEIKILKRAAKAAKSVIVRTLPFIRAGVSEIDIAEKMEAFAMEIKGVSGLAFPAIIASGPNGARPHAEVTSRKIEEDDFVTVDFGVTLDGYASDITRTYIIGNPSEKQRKIYMSVLRAQKAGIAAAKAGVACRDLDAVCRALIEKDGYGEYFIHTTGHGVGAEVHEDPRLGKNSEDILEPNMVVTIEPGIYIEGWGGVRIEDTVVITETGCEVITSGITKKLIFQGNN